MLKGDGTEAVGCCGVLNRYTIWEFVKTLQELYILTRPKAYIGLTIEGSLHISSHHPTISYLICKLLTGITRRASPVLGRWCLCVSSTDFDCLPPRAAMLKISKLTLKLWHSGPTALGWMQVFKTGSREREREEYKEEEETRERVDLWISWAVLHCQIVTRREHKTRNQWFRTVFGRQCTVLLR